MESIRSVPGVGSKLAGRFEALGIRTLEDMLSFMPRSYDDRTRERMIGETTEENPTAICRIHVRKASSFYNRKGEKNGPRAPDAPRATRPRRPRRPWGRRRRPRP